MIDKTAASGFSAGADAYERGRPSYPDAAVDLIGDVAGRDVLDLGAGTGKLTSMLVERGAHVVAVEPVAEMRAKIAGVEALDGTAEAIPLADASVDVVTCAQAFHWFDPTRALPEIARVLRDGGTLALLWNEPDDDVSWVNEVRAAYDWHTQRPYAKDTDWAGIIDASGLFGPVAHEQFRWGHVMDADTLVARVLSTSYVATWSAQQQAQTADKVRALVADLGPTFELPHLTYVYWCKKRS